ncbi:MAG: hypothetical protein ACE5JD_10570 [Candidatus Methylomirabilia bacterium]
MRLIVLVLNCGSSSVKFQVIEPYLETPSQERDRRLARGTVAHLGGEATVTFQAEGGSERRSREPVLDHGAAVRRILMWTASTEGATPDGALRAVGHRAVHGGERFTESVLIDEKVLATIEQLDELAPLHLDKFLSMTIRC